MRTFVTFGCDSCGIEIRAAAWPSDSHASMPRDWIYLYYRECRFYYCSIKCAQEGLRGMEQDDEDE